MRGALIASLVWLGLGAVAVCWLERRDQPSLWLHVGKPIALGAPARAAKDATAGWDAWGRSAEQVSVTVPQPGQHLLVKAGLTPLEAIRAATAHGPLTLGPQAPRSGQLAEGLDADFVIMDRDPLPDIALLADPARVLGVWKAGQRVKGFDAA